MIDWGDRYSRIPHVFFDDEAVLEAGDQAAMLLLRISDFAARNLTDGRITRRQLNQLGTGRGRVRALERLVACRLLDELDDGNGWEIVGWLDGHRSAAEVAKIRETRRKSGAKGGRAKRPPPPDDEADGKQVAKQSASGLLNPETDTETDTEEQPLPPTARPELRAVDGGRGGGSDSEDDSAAPGLTESDAAVAIGETFGLDAKAALASGIAGAVLRGVARGWTTEQLVDLAGRAEVVADKPRHWWAATIDKAEPPGNDDEFWLMLTDPNWSINDPVTERSAT